MKTTNEPQQQMIQETFDEEATIARWVPDLEERLQTLERANDALESIRALLEKVNRVEDSKDKPPGD